jgi:hypothetical protein
LRESEHSLQSSAPIETKPWAWAINPKEYKQELTKAFYALLLIIFIPTVFIHHRQVGKWFASLETKVSGPLSTVVAASMTKPRAATVETNFAKEVKSELEFTLPLPASAAPGLLEMANGHVSVAAASQAQPVEAKSRKLGAGSKELVVQVAAFAQEEEAQKLVEGLRHENFKAFVHTLPEDSLYRVTLGPYADAASARSSIAKLKKAGHDGFIRREVVLESLGIS